MSTVQFVAEQLTGLATTHRPRHSPHPPTLLLPLRPCSPARPPTCGDCGATLKVGAPLRCSSFWGPRWDETWAGEDRHTSSKAATVPLSCHRDATGQHVPAISTGVSASKMHTAIYTCPFRSLPSGLHPVQ